MSKQCRNCGADLPEDASFCPLCAQSQIERREVKPPRLWRKKALITAGCALVLAAAVLCPSLAVRGGENHHKRQKKGKGFFHLSFSSINKKVRSRRVAVFFFSFTMKLPFSFSE